MYSFANDVKLRFSRLNIQFAMGVILLIVFFKDKNKITVFKGVISELKLVNYYELVIHDRNNNL